MCKLIRYSSKSRSSPLALVLQSLHFVLKLLGCVLVTPAGGQVMTQAWEGQAARAAATALTLGADTGGVWLLTHFTPWKSTGVGHWFYWKYSTWSKRSFLGVLEQQWHWKYPINLPEDQLEQKRFCFSKLQCFTLCWHSFLRWKKDKSSFFGNALFSLEAEDARAELTVKPWVFCLRQTRWNRTNLHWGHTKRMVRDEKEMKNIRVFYSF